MNPTVLIARCTKPRHYLTKNGWSKKKEYLQIEGAPLIVTEVMGEFLTLNSLTSSSARRFQIPLEELTNDFDHGILDENKFITNIDPEKYPNQDGVNVSEFQKRDDFGQFKKDIEGWVRELDDDSKLKQVFEDKLFQMIQTQGAQFETIPNIERFILETSSEESTQQSNNTRFGNQIFNRNSRWCPVADNISWEDFNTSNSYPYPLGIRAKDFCLPSEMINVLVEMIRQILNFKNVDQIYRTQMQEIFNNYNIQNAFAEPICHCCKYCGEEINLNEYESNYASEHNYIEICHRDPNSHFCIKNMYWGHGECNRRQGGYTERQRIQGAIRLIRCNPEAYPPEDLDELIKVCERAKRLQLTLE